MLNIRKKRIISIEVTCAWSSEERTNPKIRKTAESRNESVGKIKANTGLFLVLRKIFSVTIAIAAATTVTMAGME